jgi:hypothetical protein
MRLALCPWHLSRYSHERPRRCSRPPGGTYTSRVTVTVTDATPGAAIYCTSNGSTPTTALTKYAGPITVTASETIKCLALATEHTPSTVASATYSILAPTPPPVFSPGGGIYTSVQSVTLTDPGATIYCTTDGSTPTAGSKKYTAPISVEVSETISCIAVAPGYALSPVASATYTVIGSPLALAAPASSITTSAAKLNAIVNTLGLKGSYWFQYGTSSTALNTTTPPTALGASAAAVPISTGLTGLTTRTRYYYSVMVTQTAGGTATGAVLSFTTS